MVKLKSDFDIKKLKEYGFTSFKVNRMQTNWYRMFMCEGLKMMILVDSVNRELGIVAYTGSGDVRVHACPRTCKREKMSVVEVIMTLTECGVIEKE